MLCEEQLTAVEADGTAWQANLCNQGVLGQDGYQRRVKGRQGWAYALLVIMPEPVEGEALAEWQRPFDVFFEQVRQHPAPRNLDELSKAELNALVHSARQRS